VDDPVRWIKEEIKRLRTNLASKEERLSLLQKEVAVLKEELRKLKVTKEVLDRKYSLPLFSKEIDAEDDALDDDDRGIGPPLPDAERAAPGSLGDDLAGSNIKDAAIKILSETNGEWLEYGEVAVRAIHRGYQSTKTGSTPESVTRSFLDIMRKMTELERDRTRFRLARFNTNGRH
jgi:hypothetical protein